MAIIFFNHTFNLLYSLFLLFLLFYFFILLLFFESTGSGGAPKFLFLFSTAFVFSRVSVLKIRHRKLASFFAPRLEGFHFSRVSVLERYPRKLVTFSILDLNVFKLCASAEIGFTTGFFLTLTDITSPNIMSCPSPLYPFRETLRS